MGSSSLKGFALLGLLPAACALALAAVAVPERAAADGRHQSLLRIGPEVALPATRQIKLGLNKSMFVELPREARDVMVSNPKKLEAVLQTSTRAYLIGAETGEANIFFNDKDGNQILTLEVIVERDLAALGELMNRLIPNSHIQVQTVGERVVLTGTVTSPLDATRASEIVLSFLGESSGGNSSSAAGGGASVTINNSGSSDGGGSSSSGSGPSEVINMLTVEGREQVLLKVSVVEMQRNITKQFGIDLGALVNSGNFAFAALTNLPFPLSGKSLMGPLFDPLPPFSGENTAALGVQWQKGPDRVTSVLRALEANGLLHTLAEPNLTAISGETANFLAGGEFPIPIAQQLGVISVEFKKFGIGLSFTPVVMSEGRISLKVSTEVSELTNDGAVISQGFRIPGLKVRRAETVVELPSGGSLVMAGLLSDQSKQALTGYPGLKSLPILGTLFRSRDFIKNETELVVLVTPYVVKPVARQQLAQPDQGFGWASDVDSDLLGQMNRVYGRNPERAPVGKFDGDVGFIVEQ